MSTDGLLMLLFETTIKASYSPDSRVEALKLTMGCDVSPTGVEPDVG